MKRTKNVKPASEADTYNNDETAAMVYVGDVYSLVVQDGVEETLAKPAPASAPAQTAKAPSVLPDEESDDDLLPFIR